MWSLERPDVILLLQNSFIDARSDLILTNSSGGTSFWLKLYVAQDWVAELNEAAAKLAQQTTNAHTKSTGRQFFVAASVEPTGELFEPFWALTHDSAVAAFGEKTMVLAEGGVDLQHHHI